MTVNTAQWLWLIATCAVMASIFADLAGFVEIPPIYWLTGSIGLTVIGWRVMPMREIEVAWEKQRRR